MIYRFTLCVTDVYSTVKPRVCLSVCMCMLCVDVTCYITDVYSTVKPLWFTPVVTWKPFSTCIVDTSPTANQVSSCSSGSCSGSCCCSCCFCRSDSNTVYCFNSYIYLWCWRIRLSWLEWMLLTDVDEILSDDAKIQSGACFPLSLAWMVRTISVISVRRYWPDLMQMW